MSLRALTVLAASPFLFPLVTGDHGSKSSPSFCGPRDGGPGTYTVNGDSYILTREGQGRDDEEVDPHMVGEVRREQVGWTRSSRSSHDGTTLQWQLPARQGLPGLCDRHPSLRSHGLHRSAAPIPQDIQVQVSNLGNDAPYHEKLMTKNIALDAAERGCLTKLEKKEEDENQEEFLDQDFQARVILDYEKPGLPREPRPGGPLRGVRIFNRPVGCPGTVLRERQPLV